jgi:hypothetical protein
VNKIVNWEVLGRSHRVFLVEKPQTWWQWFTQKPVDHEVLIFSGKRVEDLPSGWTGPVMPDKIKNGTALDRFVWRQEQGLVSFSPDMKRIVEGK